jgi:hypothetical protein
MHLANQVGDVMRCARRVVLVLTGIAILGFIPSAWPSTIGNGPKPGTGPRQAQITNASRDLVSIVGDRAQITAIQGNRITIQHLNDASRAMTVTVDNATLFRVGQHVTVTESLLTPQ